MEFKHFSHNHGLDFHQMPQGSKGQCSGCKSPVSGNIYACWQCNHFLHEQCYHAARSLRHPSHPPHPLTLVQNPTYQSGTFHCQSCKLIGNGLSYACAECQFDMHVQCALASTQNQHVSPFPVSNTASNYNPQPQNPAYPNNTKNFTQQTYNAHPHNHMYSHNTQSFVPRPQYSTHSTFPGIGGSTNQNGQLHFPQPNPPMPNYSHNVSSPYTSPPIQPPTTPTYNTGINPIATTTSNPPPPLPPPFYNPTNQTPHSGGLTNPNNPFPPPYHQQNTTLPNYSPQTSNPYINHPTPLSGGIPTRDNMVNQTTNTFVANHPPPPPPQPFYHSTTLAPETNTRESNPSSIIKHFSHPHVLKQIELEATTGKTCSACECSLFGSSYCCTEPYCTFNLHKTCFDSPQELHHKSHSHPLRLVTSPPYATAFTCNACLKECKAFAYNCATCSYDLHINCVSKYPEKMTRPDHKHELTLNYSSASTHSGQDVTFFCDVCKNPVHESAWVYDCHECDFGTHLECMASEVKQERVDSHEKRVGELISDTEQLRIAYLGALIENQGRECALDLWD